ncbi:hypothetical protein M899_0417 [Bacteriovorax sp. BSW11_IV]|uniref:hypothetical protein n=1 Tax=Bacteriovorax sp. BSW11_IV TaxID=1353529 RepID=UPI000389F696|nr:hypothetical protein [Bacteriovorax sp. BSW11_IV]EQC43069.1 hypothetical protein M899_0417 [Bacteriovorax sp. BSW11_IV]
MNTFILLEKNQRVIDILKPALAKEFNVNVEVGSSADDVSLLLKKENQFSIVLARNIFEDVNEKIEFAKLAFNCLYDIESEVPLITFGDVDFTYQNLKSLPDRFKVNDLFMTVKEVLNLSSKDMESIKTPDFVPVPLNNFYLMTSCFCDVYIRIQKDGKDHYVKRIKSGDVFDKDVIKKYEDMKLESFYVQKEDHEEFLDQLLDQSVQKVVETTERDAHIEVIADSYGISQNLIDDLGFSKQVVTMSNAAIGSMMKNISDTGFGAMLRDLLKNKNSFSYKRSYLISLFSYQVIPRMDWGQSEKQINQNFEKMVFVSFFHDILLKEETHLKIMSQSDLKDADLPGFQQTLINEHANKVSTMVQRFPKAPPGADVIIRQHHGTLNGVGFSEGPSNNISPMALVFVVIEDFVHQLLMQLESGKISTSDLFVSLEAKYKLVNYKKVVTILKRIVKAR